MKIRLPTRCAAGLVLVLAVAAVAPSTKPTVDAPVLASHSRIQPHRDTDGTLKRGPSNEIETSNWSGYAVSYSQTGKTYTQAQATWTVNPVSYVTPPPTCHVYRFGKHGFKICSSQQPQWEYSSSWVGIGGYCEDLPTSCGTVDNTLIQLGTEHDASVIGTTEYYAWIEMLPNNPIIISPPESYPNCNSLACAYPVQPGDVITASLQCTSNCTPGGGPQNWLLLMSNQSTAHAGWSFSTNVPYNSTLLSAEWIQEAPSSSAGVLPLANFGTAGFDPSDGAALVLDASADSIQLADPYGETSNPSSPGAAEAFNACWGNAPAPAFTNCAAP